MAELDELVIIKDKFSLKNPNFTNPIVFDMAGYNDTNGRSVTVRGDTSISIRITKPIFTELK